MSPRRLRVAERVTVDRGLLVLSVKITSNGVSVDDFVPVKLGSSSMG